MSGVQSVRFKLSQWHPADALAWLAAHHFKPLKTADVTRTEARFRLADPGKFRRFATKKLPNGVNLVIGFR